MKAADSATYKQTHYFRDDFRDTGEEHPSIEGQPKINTTIKENPYRSNVEIEGGEIVLQPDLSALFKAEGKKHSKGGMDVLLRPESFIFSDFKDLAITEDDKELFELKKGGSTSPDKNTPAEIVKKNVNVKHYNSLINNITDPYKDDLARKSSAMMLEKYIATLGNIAYLQEEKKEFPDGLPAFSMGTAPVYEESTKEAIDESKQYAKYGGTVMQMGGFPRRFPTKPSKKSTTPVDAVTVPAWGPWQGDKLKVFQERYGVTNAADKFGDFKNWDAVAKELGYTGPKDNLAFQKWLYNSSKENREVIEKWHNKYNVGPNEGMFDKKIGIRWASAIDEIRKRTFPNIDLVHQPSFSEPPRPEEPTKAPENVPGQMPPSITGDPQGVKRADWKFTPWQKISQLYNWGQYANVRRYMPFRSRYNATYADPSLLNPEQTIGDVKGQVTQQLSALGTLNPIMRNAQAAASFGAALNQIPAIRSQYDNQNAQIANQFRQFNTQIRNNESLINMSNDQTYYTQAVEGRKNFDNMRSFTANNAMNNVLRDVETNQKLAYNLLTLNNPAYGYDWTTGDFYRNQKDIRDVQSSNAVDFYGEFLKEVDEARTPEDLEKLKIKERLMRQKNILPFLQQASPLMGKKGGKVKNPYK